MRYDSELFCLLNANGIDIEHIPSGGPGLLDKDAICMALAGSTRPQMGLALYMSGVDSEHKNIWAGLFQKAINTHLYREMKEKNRHKIDPLCCLAIFEFTNRPYCKACNGTGLNEDHIICHNCNGVGIKPISNSKRASVLGKTHKSWYQFSDLYTLLIKTLQQWQEANERKLNRKLR
ncbi:MAG: hypothetical protein GY774_20000 [Planctomycetes bacterium]|nr:hypothetical protein [Planctomycetota bacterium]